MLVPDGTVRCCLCKGFVSTSSKERFRAHMNNEHNTFFNTDFLLAACQLNSVNPTDFGIVKTIMEGMWEENIRSQGEEEQADLSSSSLESSSLENSSSSLVVSRTRTRDYMEGEEERLVIDEGQEAKPTLQLPDYPDIPMHLIDEFEKLCDKREESEEGFEPSINKPQGGPGPCKMLKTGKDIVKRSLSMKSLKGVLGAVDESKSKTFDCPHCEKSFHLSFLLKKHVSSNHGENNGKNPHPCPFCKKSFRFSILLRRHVQYKHKDNNPTVGKDFSSEKEDFPCELCGKTFTQIGNMKRHVKTIHADVSEYDCNECGKTFSQIANLRRHQQSHPSSCAKKDPPMEEEDKKLSAGDLRVFQESLV